MAEEITGDEDEKNILEFLQIGTIYAIPADEKLWGTVNFMKIVSHCINHSDDQVMTDDCGQIITPGQVFIEWGHCLHQFRADMNQHILKTRGEYSFSRKALFI